MGPLGTRLCFIINKKTKYCTNYCGIFWLQNCKTSSTHSIVLHNCCHHPEPTIQRLSLSERNVVRFVPRSGQISKTLHCIFIQCLFYKPCCIEYLVLSSRCHFIQISFKHRQTTKTMKDINFNKCTLGIIIRV